MRSLARRSQQLDLIATIANNVFQRLNLNAELQRCGLIIAEQRPTAGGL
jgi:hypothetical protein